MCHAHAARCRLGGRDLSPAQRPHRTQRRRSIQHPYWTTLQARPGPRTACSTTHAAWWRARAAKSGAAPLCRRVRDSYAGLTTPASRPVEYKQLRVTPARLCCECSLRGIRNAHCRAPAALALHPCADVAALRHLFSRRLGKINLPINQSPPNEPGQVGCLGRHAQAQARAAGADAAAPVARLWLALTARRPGTW